MKAVSDAVRAGDLDRAMSLAENVVRDAPSSAGPRAVLADVLALRGDLERAETHLSALLRFDPSQVREVQTAIQLLRAESDRQQVFSEGRTPEFLFPPTEPMRLRLGALAHLREGDVQRGGELLQAAADCESEWAATTVADSDAADARSGAAPFADWDSRFGAVLEGLSATGKYYWIPFCSVASIEFSPLGSFRDLVWRSAVVTFGAGGPQVGPVENVALLFVPTRYPGSERAEDGLVRAGMATEWTEPRPGVGIGMGQRTFVCGERAMAAASIRAVRADACATEGRQPGVEVRT